MGRLVRLGTNRLNTHQVSEAFLDFESARKEVHKLKLKNQEAWLEYSKSGKKAINIPSNPHKIYPNEWINMGDWLGTYNLADRERSKLFLPFKQARKFARSLKLKNSNDWRRWCKENDTRIISHTPNHNY